jgi:Flp pilus assembly protein TadG
MMGKRRFDWLRDLARDDHGVTVVEFGLMLPLLVFIGAGGLELINFVLANQKIERIASITADNVARNTLAPSERSFVDTFSGVEEIAEPFDFNVDGRIIMTGVIGVPSGTGTIVGKVVWQRCTGALAGIGSTVGTQATNPNLWANGPDATLPAGVTLLQNQLVVISEVAYRYRPLISLAQLRAPTGGDIVRQRSIYVSRGQAFPYVTPVSGVTPAAC